MIIRRLLIPLLAFTSFLVTGLLIGNRLGNAVKDYHAPFRNNAQEMKTADDADRLAGFNAPQLPHFTPPVPENVINPGKAPQRNILVVAVDAIDANQPRLEAVWLLLYLPNLPHVTLMPIYPRVVSSDSTITIDADDKFIEKFKLTSENQPAPAFFEALLAKNIWWNNYLLVEKFALDKLVDTIGGSANNPHITYEIEAESSISQAVDKLISTRVDPHAGLLSQAQFAQRLCRMSTKQALTAKKIRFLFSQLDEHIITDLSPEQIAADVKSMLEHSGGISCEFPSLAPISIKH